MKAIKYSHKWCDECNGSGRSTPKGGLVYSTSRFVKRKVCKSCSGTGKKKVA